MKNARPLLLAASAVALLVSACSQAPADLKGPTLAPQFGTADEDVGVDVAVSSVDHVYVLSDQDLECDESVPQRVLLRRYDSGGNLAWNKQVIFSEYNYDTECEDLRARILQTDAQGNTYVLVSHSGISDDVRYYITYNLYKYDAAGNLLTRIDNIGKNYWAFEEPDAEHENAIDMAVDGGGNVYLAYESSEFDYGSSESSTTNLVSKYSTTGARQWQRVSTVGLPYGITVSSSGSVYVVGTTGIARYTNSGSLTWSKAADNSKGVRSGDIVISGYHVYTRSVKDIRKYDGTGKQLWLKTQAGLDTIVLQDMTGDANGNLYLSGKYQVSTGNFNAFTRKLNSSGSVIFTKTYGTTAYDDALGVATLNGSEIYLTGETQGSLAHPNRGGRDGYLRKLDSSGNTVWTR